MLIPVQRQRLFLTSTKQEVFDLPWSAHEMPKPWPQGYRRIMRPFLKHEGVKSGLKAEVTIVRESKLERK